MTIRFRVWSPERVEKKILELVFLNNVLIWLLDAFVIILNFWLINPADTPTNQGADFKNYQTTKQESHQEFSSGKRIQEKREKEKGEKKGKEKRREKGKRKVKKGGKGRKNCINSSRVWGRKFK